MDLSEFMSREDVNEVVSYLKKKDKTTYSISRLNAYNDCQYAYYRSYVLKDRGENNIYGILGGDMHNHLENICHGEETVEGMRDKFKTNLFAAKLFSAFPSESVGENWENNINHFLLNFEPLKDEVLTEQGFVINLDGIYIQGYIDVLCLGEEVYVLDWKTSSKFTKDKLRHAGRQLVLYKLAVEQLTGKNVDKLMWYMIKYVNVHYENKVKQCERGKIVKELSGLITTQLKKLGFEAFEIETMLNVSIINNSLETLPKEVVDRFTIKPCILEYDVTEELIEETKLYIKNTVCEIEGKNPEDDTLWRCKDISKDKGFFCKNLCGSKNKCKLYKLMVTNKKI